jgi:hypothetical protein
MHSRADANKTTPVQRIEAWVERIPSPGDLTVDEMMSLRLIVAGSFISKGSVPAARRARLLELGLIQSGMGGVMPTPAGRMVARL